MAVQNQTPYNEYTANGSTTSFALGFDCESQNHLIVLIDDSEPEYGSWYLENNTVIFRNAPQANQKISMQRNTPFKRETDFQSYDNSFRPTPVNKDLDRIWWKLQELGVADWLLGLKIDKEIKDRIAADIYYYQLIAKETDEKLSEIKAYIEALVNNVSGNDFLPILDKYIKTWSGLTQESKNKQTVTPLDFGALRGRENAPKNTVAFNLMATFIQDNSDSKVDLLGGTWFLDGTFYIPDHALYEGRGTAYWQVTSPKGGSGYVDLAATQIVMISKSNNKVHTIHGISSMSASGGVVTNPSARQGFNEATYSLESFTATDHKPKPFSVACKVGKGARLKGFRVIPDGGGVDGLDLYRIEDGTAETSWAADWDVGLWVDAVSGVQTNDVQFVGHWRKTGKLVTSISSDINVTGTAYNNTYSNSVFAGYKPVIVRGADSFRVVGIGSNYVDVNTTPDHPFNVESYPYVWLHKNSFSGNRYNLVNVVENGATTRLTINGDPTAQGYAVGSSVASRAYGGGSSQNQFSACQFTGLNHASKLVCNDQRLGAKAFAYAGGAIEISGYRVVEVLFDDKCSWQSYENVFMHIHDAHHIVWCGAVEVNSDTDNNQGARVIASPSLTLNKRVTNPSGYTNGLLLDLKSTFLNTQNGNSSLGLDFRPHYSAYSGNIFTNTLDDGFAEASFISIPHLVLLDSVHTNVGIRTPKNKYGGFYDYGGNLVFAYNGTSDLMETRTSIFPNQNNAHDLGSSDNRMRVVYSRLFNAGDSYNINGVKVVGVQQTAIANAASGTEIATINAILGAMRNHGLIAR